MADQCCDASGGRVELRINGVLFSTRAGITLRPTAYESEAGSNDDGSIYVTTKPMPAEAEFTLGDKCGLTMDFLEQCYVDATIFFVDMKKTYLMTRATVVGRPEISSDSGEISGLKLVSRICRQIA